MLRCLVFAIFSVSFISCAALRAECLTHGGAAWLDIETRHFTLRTNMDADGADDAATELEKSLTVLRHVFPAKVESPSRIEAVIFQNNQQLYDLTGIVRIEGLMFEDWHGSMVVMGSADGLFGSRVKRSVVMHELTHHFFSYALARQPRWLAEGLAQYLEGSTVHDSTVRIGDVNERALKTLNRRTPLAFDALWEWNDSELSNPTLKDLHYATSWLFVHYLRSQRGEQFAQYLKALANNRPPRVAFAEVFTGVDGKVLDKEVRDYLKRGEYPASVVALEKIDENFEQHRLSDADIHALLARITVTRKRRNQELDAAMSLAPSAPKARALRILYDDDPAKQLEAALQFTESSPLDATAWRLLGRALIQNHAPADEAVIAFRKAYALAPANPRVLEDLGGALLAAGSAGESLPFLRKAARLAPYRPAVIADLAAALALTQKCGESGRVFEQAKELIDVHDEDNEGDDDLQQVREQVKRAVAACLAQR